MNTTEVPSSARKQALAWFVRLQSGVATDADRQDFAVWRAAHPDHAREYARLDQLWVDLDDLKPRHVGTPRTLAERYRPFSYTPVAERHRKPWLALAAMLLLALIGGLWHEEVLLRWQSDYLTARGEQRAVTLPDNTIAFLDTGTAIKLDYSAAVRSLILLKGRADFTVTPDPHRPFEVSAGRGVTRAVGTEFEVDLRDDEVNVTVQAGKVTVALTAALTRSMALNVGETLRYHRQELGAKHTTDTRLFSAWRRGKLIFQDQSLETVIAEVNRYRTGLIVLTDTRLKQLRVSGIFDLHNPEGMLAAILDTLPVRAHRATRFLLVLTPV